MIQIIRDLLDLPLPPASHALVWALWLQILGGRVVNRLFRGRP